MNLILSFCCMTAVLTALLVVSVNTQNISRRHKMLQRSSREEALVGHVIHSTQASSDINCLIHCSREHRCLSFNYKSDKDDGSPVCELNDQTRESRPDSIVPMDGYYYYGPESSCTSDLCFNGGTCHPVTDDPHQRYRCQCHPDFTADRCQYAVGDFDVMISRRSASDYVLLRGKMPHQLTSFTVSLFVNLIEDTDGTFVSYATPLQQNAIFLYQRNSVIRLRVNNDVRYFSTYKIRADGRWHHLALTWENTQGTATLYIDGTTYMKIMNMATRQRVEANGIVAIGNDQDKFGGGFVAGDALYGSISRVNIWNRVLPQHDIISLAAKCGNEAGATVAWKDFRKGKAGLSYHGEAQFVVPSICKKP